MSNNVQIFEDLVFNSELDSNFTNWKLDSHNLRLSQGDSQGVSFTARSYDLACPGVVSPMVRGLLAACRQYRFIFTQLQICQLLHSLLMKLPHWSAHPCQSQHPTILREYSSFTREWLIRAKRPMSYVPIFRHKNSDVRFRCLVVYQN